MTDPDGNTSSAIAHHQAMHWFTKARLGTLSPQEQQMLKSWRAANPEHERQYRALDSLWQVADRLPEEEMRAILAQQEADEPTVPQRRRFMIGTGAAATAALVAGVVGHRIWLNTPAFTATLRTARGERKRLDLPDGSVLDLNTATQVTVAFYSDRRVAHLIAGEALFSVSKDSARPFSVEAGHADVLVTGTRFNMRRDEDAVTVAVEEGTVEFSSGPWWRRTMARLRAGYVSRAPVDGVPEAPYPSNVATLMSWQRGRLVFQDAPLSGVVSELNRYLAHPLSISDDGTGGIRISGTVGIDSPHAVLDVLPRIAPVKVLRQKDGGLVIVAPR